MSISAPDFLKTYFYNSKKLKINVHMHINILKIRFKFQMKLFCNLSYTKKINF
jgi:hypothetical protein